MSSDLNGAIYEAALKYSAGGGGSSASPSVTTGQGLGSLATSQVTVGVTATSIAAARATRGSITIVNSGTTDVFIGPAGVTLVNGVLLSGVKGATITLNTTAAVFGITTVAQIVSVAETF